MGIARKLLPTVCFMTLVGCAVVQAQESDDLTPNPDAEQLKSCQPLIIACTGCRQDRGGLDLSPLPPGFSAWLNTIADNVGGAIVMTWSGDHAEGISLLREAELILRAGCEIEWQQKEAFYEMPPPATERLFHFIDLHSDALIEGQFVDPAAFARMTLFLWAENSPPTSEGSFQELWYTMLAYEMGTKIPYLPLIEFSKQLEDERRGGSGT